MKFQTDSPKGAKGLLSRMKEAPKGLGTISNPFYDVKWLPLDRSSFIELSLGGSQGCGTLSMGIVPISK